jgi:ketosteroid isomerase-like protein
MSLRSPLATCVLILSAALPLGGQQTSPAPRASDVAVTDTIRRLMAELDQAASALDVNRFMSHFLRDSSLVYGVAGTARRGWAEVERSHRESWSRLAEASFRLGDPAITVLAPDAAVATSVGEARLTRKDGSTGGGPFAVTAIWRRLPEGWRIVQMHESFPTRRPPGAGQ